MRKTFRHFRRFLRERKGQSVLEFALLLPFIFFFIFLHIQLCLTYVVAKYTNYVSYMAARSVLTNGHLKGKHTGVVNRYIREKFGGFLNVRDRLIRFDPLERRFVNTNGRINPGPQYRKSGQDDTENRNLGVEISYSIPVFLPFLGEFGESLRFKTQTVLGREPYHGDSSPEPFRTSDPVYGDSFDDKSACRSVYNDNGC